MTTPKHRTVEIRPNFLSAMVVPLKLALRRWEKSRFNTGKGRVVQRQLGHRTRSTDFFRPGVRRFLPELLLIYRTAGMPGSFAGRGPGAGQWNLRSLSSIATSLMLASLRRIRPASSNSQSSLPYARNHLPSPLLYSYWKRTAMRLAVKL